MKKSRFATLFVCAATLGALSMGTSFAQPAPAAMPTLSKKGKAKAPKGSRGLTKRMTKALEDKLGKPLTADQKTQLNAAYKVRQEATKAAEDKFLQDAATTTGLSVETLRDTLKHSKKDDKGAKTPPAPR